MKLSILLLSILFLFGCNGKEKNQEDTQIENSKKMADKAKILEDHATAKLNGNKSLENIDNLKQRGIVGKWECDFSGYESIISLIDKNSKQSIEVDFTKSKMKTKLEELKKEGNRYLVVGSKAKEYYVINDLGNLELWDKDGIFTTAINIMPGTKTSKKSEINLEQIIGEDIFTVVGNHSKSPPKTLEGTTNKIWKVYYEDLNVIFDVDKRTGKIIKAAKK